MNEKVDWDKHQKELIEEIRRLKPKDWPANGCVKIYPGTLKPIPMKKDAE